jgi:diguanylate cyclase (GGDEF)-like protein/PAS domain S-box-containing protein
LDIKSMSDSRQIDELGAGGIALSVLRAQAETSTLVFDRRLRYVLAAGEALERHGFDRAKIEGRLASEVLGERRWETYEPLYRSALNGESRALELWSPDDTRCYQIEVGPLRDAAGEIVGGVVIGRDITQRKHAEEARRHAQERFELAFEQAPIGMALLSPEGRWVRVNHALLEMTGYSPDEILSKNFQELTHPDDLSADLEQVRQLLAGEIRHYQMEKRYFHADGHLITAMLSVSLVRDRDGEPLHFISQIQDITERKAIEERLRHLADHDPLTGLHNRRLLERELARQVGRCRRHGEHAALLVLDLDGFKRVNDTYGHKTGDDLLKAVAAELERRLRGTDLVARLGGDEFAVLLPNVEGAAAYAVAEDLKRLVAGCVVSVGERRVSLTVSIGLAVIDQDAASDEAVLIEADRAMYAAKENKAGLSLEGHGAS